MRGFPLIRSPPMRGSTLLHYTALWHWVHCKINIFTKFPVQNTSFNTSRAKIGQLSNKHSIFPWCVKKPKYGTHFSKRTVETCQIKQQGIEQAVEMTFFSLDHFWTRLNNREYSLIINIIFIKKRNDKYSCCIAKYSFFFYYWWVVF